MAIPAPYGSKSSVQAGPPDRVTVNYKGSAAEWRAFYTAALARGWTAAGNCWERKHPINGKTENLCVEPGAASAAIQITER